MNVYKELSWSYGSWIYNYLCNHYLSPLKVWVRIPPRWGVLNTTLCDKVCQRLVAGRWFSPGTPVSSTNKTDHNDINEILLKVALNTKTQIHSIQLFMEEYLCLVKFLFLALRQWHFRVFFYSYSASIHSKHHIR